MTQEVAKQACKEIIESLKDAIECYPTALLPVERQEKLTKLVDMLNAYQVAPWDEHLFKHDIGAALKAWFTFDQLNALGYLDKFARALDVAPSFLWGELRQLWRYDNQSPKKSINNLHIAVCRNPLSARTGNKKSGYLIQRKHENKLRWQYSYRANGKNHTHFVPDSLAEDVRDAIVRVVPAREIVVRVLCKNYKGN